MRYYTLLGLLTELDNLNSEELLEVKAKVDKLVQLKTSNVTVWENINPQSQASSNITTVVPVPHDLQGFIKEANSKSISSSSQGIDKNQTDMQALDSMIELVDNWLKDDSGYDEEIYPLIEASLTQD
jgi:hypothetical protein